MWETIKEQLAEEIASGTLAPGEQLPVEAGLMARFGVGRHTIRRVVSELAASGLVRVEQGRGTFVHDFAPLDYRLSERTRFSQNLLDQGREPDGRTIADETVAAPDHVADALRLPAGEMVYHLTSIGWADDQPISYGHAFFPARRFPDLPAMKRARGSTSAVFAAYSIDDYVRLKTVITTRLPTRREATALRQPVALPVIVTAKVDTDLQGVPISLSETTWAGERVQFSIDNFAGLFGATSGHGGTARHDRTSANGPA